MRLKWPPQDYILRGCLMEFKIKELHGGLGKNAGLISLIVVLKCLSNNNCEAFALFVDWIRFVRTNCSCTEPYCSNNRNGTLSLSEIANNS